MDVTQVVYTSRRADGLSDAELEAIVAASARRNRDRDVSGVLMLCGRSVMQLLEGDAGVVDALYARIAADPRHSDVHRLLRKRVARRLCPQWGMKLLDPVESGVLDLKGLAAMIADVQASHDTAGFSIGARVLLNEFRERLTRPPDRRASAQPLTSRAAVG